MNIQHHNRSIADRHVSLPSAFANPNKDGTTKHDKTYAQTQPQLIVNGKENSHAQTKPRQRSRRKITAPVDHIIHVDDNDHTTSQHQTIKATVIEEESKPIALQHDAENCLTDFRQFSSFSIEPHHISINILPVNTISFIPSGQNHSSRNEDDATPIQSTGDLQLVISKLRAHMLSALRADNEQITHSLDYLGSITRVYRQHSPHFTSLANLDRMMSLRTYALCSMFQTHQHWQMQHKTFHLAVSMFDRYMASPRSCIDQDNITLTALGSLFLAYKLEDNRTARAPTFEQLSRNRFNRNDAKGMESRILNAISFFTTVPTVLDFALQFLYLFTSTQQRDIPEHLRCPSLNINPSSGRYFRLLRCIEFLSDVAVSDGTYTNHSPIGLGAAVLYVALAMLNVDFTQSWNISLHLLTGLTSEDIIPIAKYICDAARIMKKNKMFEPFMRRYSSEYCYHIATALDIPSPAQLEQSVAINNHTIVDFLSLYDVDPQAMTFVSGLHVKSLRVLNITDDRPPVYDESTAHLLDTTTSSTTNTDCYSSPGKKSSPVDSLAFKPIVDNDRDTDDDDSIYNQDGTINMDQLKEKHACRQMAQATKLLSPVLRDQGNTTYGSSPSKSISMYHYQREYLVTFVRESSMSNFFIQDMHTRHGETIENTLAHEHGKNEPGIITITAWMKHESIYEFEDGDVALTEYKSAKKLAKFKAQQQRIKSNGSPSSHPSSDRHHEYAQSNAYTPPRRSLPPLPSPLIKNNSYSRSSMSSSASSLGQSSSFAEAETCFTSPRPHVGPSKRRAPAPLPQDDISLLIGSPKYQRSNVKETRPSQVMYSSAFVPSYHPSSLGGDANLMHTSSTTTTTTEVQPQGSKHSEDDRISGRRQSINKKNNKGCTIM